MTLWSLFTRLKQTQIWWASSFRHPSEAASYCCVGFGAEQSVCSSTLTAADTRYYLPRNRLSWIHQVITRIPSTYEGELQLFTSQRSADRSVPKLTHPKDSNALFFNTCCICFSCQAALCGNTRGLCAVVIREKYSHM